MTQDVDFRPEVVEECALMGLEPLEAVRRCAQLSSLAYLTFAPDGTPLAYWGVQEHSVLGGVAEMWMLSLKGMEHHSAFVARECYVGIRQMLERHVTIYANVDVQFSRAVRWLTWLGFREVDRRGRFARMMISRGDL